MNIDENPRMRFGDVEARLETFDNPQIVPTDITLISYPRRDCLELRLLGNTRVLPLNSGEMLLGKLERIIEGIIGEETSLEAQGFIEFP